MKKKIKSKKVPVPKISTKEYVSVLQQIKKQIENSQLEALNAINIKLNKRNWLIGKIITEQQQAYGWGSNFIEKLAHDIQNLYPDIEGFSRTNIFRMKAFYETYQKNPTAVGQIEDLQNFKIPWGHNAVLLEKLKDNNQRIWYAQKAIEYGWSRSMLETWIKSDLYKREGKSITNFSKTLPPYHSDMAQQSLKDPYVFDFLTLNKEHVEHELEQGLIDNVQKLLLELGTGFAFVARQYHLEIGNQDYYIDLLFYNYTLRCFVVIELKARAFDPRDAGQLNFYLSAVDDLLRHPDDNPTIGLIICKTKNNFIAEYALRDIKKPIGVSGYETQLIKKLPKELKSSLPTIKEIEAELEKTDLLNKQKTKVKIKK